MRVAVFGEGVHSERYKDALLFYRDDIDVISVNKGGIGNIEATLLVISEPFTLDDFAECEVDALEKYRCVILEKLPTHSSLKLNMIENHLRSNTIITVHTRLFCKRFINANDLRNMSIKWPNLYQGHMDPYWNTLPNVLDFIYSNEGVFPQLSNSKCILLGDGLLFVTDMEDRSYKVHIYNGDIRDKVLINGIELPWPNYIECYHKAFDSFHEEANRKASLKYTLEEITFLNQLWNTIKS